MTAASSGSRVSSFLWIHGVRFSGVGYRSLPRTSLGAAGRAVVLGLVVPAWQLLDHVRRRDVERDLSLTTSIPKLLVSVFTSGVLEGATGHAH